MSVLRPVKQQHGKGCIVILFSVHYVRYCSFCLLFPKGFLLLYPMTVIDSYDKLLCQSSCKSIMKMMCTRLKMIVNCFWLIRIMSHGDANQHWAYIVLCSYCHVCSCNKFIQISVLKMSYKLRQDAYNGDFIGEGKGWPQAERMKQSNSFCNCCISQYIYQFL